MSYRCTVKTIEGTNMKLSTYIAFSIHGTFCFITAKKDIAVHVDTYKKAEEGKLTDIIIDGYRCTAVKSRRPDYDFNRDGIKISHPLLSRADGKPYRCPIKVLTQFNMLEAQGWKVEKDHFIERFWKNKRR